MTMEQRETLRFKAKLAEKAERFDEMAVIMKEIVAQPPHQLSTEERDLFVVAYKNLIGGRRAAWFGLSSSNDDDHNFDSSTVNHRTAPAYKEQIESELSMICSDVLSLLDKYLIPSAAQSSIDALISLYKMKGDFHRYLAEIQTGDARVLTSQAALEAYQTASTNAETDLVPTDPLCLGLALNVSVFYKEILDMSDKAYQVAKHAFDDALANLAHADELLYDDTVLIMKLLLDNLLLWSSMHTNHDNQVKDSSERPMTMDEELQLKPPAFCKNGETLIQQSLQTRALGAVNR